jgi:hypothetical protein
MKLALWVSRAGVGLGGFLILVAIVDLLRYMANPKTDMDFIGFGLVGLLIVAVSTGIHAGVEREME